MKIATAHSCRGFSLFEVAILVVSVGILVVVLLPSFISKRPRTSPANACINNLRQIDAAANQFALEKNLTNGSPIHFPTDLTNYIMLTSAGKIHACPSGGIYSIKKVGGNPVCSLGTNVASVHVLP